MKRWSRLILLSGLVLTVAFLFKAGLIQALTFERLKLEADHWRAVFDQHPTATVAVYFLIYIATTALSLPGATILTLAGGALFGFGPALLIVSFASTMGATLAMLISRFLLRDWVEKRFRDRVAAINSGLRREGGFYLLSLRLLPIFPFFMVNLVMGLTQVPARRFFWVSQLGMLPGTMAYVNAGTQLAELNSVAEIASLPFLLSIILLGILPLILKSLLNSLRARQVYRSWTKPSRYDYNLVVIGAGAGGLISAYIGAAVKAKVALIENAKMGGDCLNYGCVPSKTLIRSAKLAHELQHAAKFGVHASNVRVDFAEVMERVQSVIAQIAPNDSVERYESLGVDCIRGHAQLVSPWQIKVDGRNIIAKNIILATGARPFIPDIPGLNSCQPLTSDNLWNLRELPKHLLVLGGGPIGCELAQCFQRLGSQVTLVEQKPHLLSAEDAEVGEFLTETFREEGMEVLVGHQATQFVGGGAAGYAELKDGRGNVRQVHFDQVLVAVGRKANTAGFGLEELGIEVSEQGRIRVDGFLRTKYPHIFAVGDVVGPYLFTHAASHQAWHATVNALFGRFKNYRVDYGSLPWCTFTDPEVARVGLSEQEARAQGVEVSVHRYNLSHLDRAIADGTNRGFVKLLVDPGKDRIVGATIVGPHAGDILQELVLAKRHGLGLNAVMSTIHTYPTLTEANKLAAGVWKKATAPEGLLRIVERFHSWQRG